MYAADPGDHEALLNDFLDRTIERPLHAALSDVLPRYRPRIAGRTTLTRPAQPGSPRSPRLWWSTPTRLDVDSMCGSMPQGRRHAGPQLQDRREDDVGWRGAEKQVVAGGEGEKTNGLPLESTDGQRCLTSLEVTLEVEQQVQCDDVHEGHADEVQVQGVPLAAAAAAVARCRVGQVSMSSSPATVMNVPSGPWLMVTRMPSFMVRPVQGSSPSRSPADAGEKAAERMA